MTVSETDRTKPEPSPMRQLILVQCLISLPHLHLLLAAVFSF